MALELRDILLRQGAFELRADFELCSGRRYGVIGPSGAGKSTLLALLAGFLDPAEGRLIWRGADITRLGPSERPVAMLFQDGNLFPHLSIFENVGLGIDPKLRLDTEARAAVLRALERVGLGGMDARKPAQLSGGQQSRAALARVLVQDRPMLLLDEPFSALGPALKAEMLSLTGEISAERGALVIMVSHDPEDIQRFTQETIVISGGQADKPRETSALFADPPVALAEYLGSSGRAL